MVTHMTKAEHEARLAEYAKETADMANELADYRNTHLSMHRRNEIAERIGALSEDAARLDEFIASEADLSVEVVQQAIKIDKLESVLANKNITIEEDLKYQRKLEAEIAKLRKGRA